MTKEIDYAVIQYEDMVLSPRHAAKIRGYFGSKYEEHILLHNHKEEGYVFTYPKVQYKVIKKKPVICGVAEGADLISKLSLKEDELIIDGHRMESVQKTINVTKDKFGMAKDYIEYEFLTPWIALNQKNIRKYNDMTNMDKEEFLKKVLIGNIISMSKGLSYTVPDKIHVWINLKENESRVKEVTMKSFVGNFKVNFHVPDFLGLGKSVSRGFGTIKRRQI